MDYHGIHRTEHKQHICYGLVQPIRLSKQVMQWVVSHKRQKRKEDDSREHEDMV